MVIGLFIPISWHWHWPKIWPIISGVIQSAEAQGARVVVYGDASPSDHIDLTRSNSGELASRAIRADGFVFAFPNASFQRYAEELQSKGIPIVLVGRRAGSVPRVLCDNHGAIRGAVVQLHARGHRRIAFIAGGAENLCAEERRRGYEAGLRDCGLELDPGLVIPGDFSAESCRHALGSVLREGLRFSAVLATNDLTAIGAVEVLREFGLSVPGDVEVTGFDNVPRAHWSSPPLSTFDMQAYQLGHVAADAVIRRIRGEAVAVEIAVPIPFVARATTRGGGRPSGFRAVGEECTEGEFFCRAQVERLRRSPAASRLLSQLADCRGQPESFSVLLQRLLSEAEQSRVRPSSLYFHVGELLAGENSARTRGAAFELLSTSALDEQKRQIESGVVFAAASLPLRELAFVGTEERQIVERLRETLGMLRIRGAGLFLAPAVGDESSGTWWDLSGAAEPTPAQLPELRRLLNDHTSTQAFMLLPLEHRAESIGMLTLSADSEFVIYYPDLAGQLAAAVHGVRMHRALARANRQLLETSRLAGIAEMATGVLHNIGNALNSVTTSVGLSTERLRHSRAGKVRQLAGLLEEHRTDLAGFLTRDPRGSRSIDYLAQLGRSLEQEQAESLRELALLRDRIDHLTQIVATQQDYANVAGVVEDVRPSELLEYALHICGASLERHEVQVGREIESDETLRVQRPKALQVLVNLINNAKDAVKVRAEAERRITVGTRLADGRMQFFVSDNGVGIAPQDLTRIFGFGFTTKPGGHGFGLHSSALAAKEMKGSLRASSDGPGCGATFVLEFPRAESGTARPFAAATLAAENLGLPRPAPDGRTG